MDVCLVQSSDMKRLKAIQFKLYPTPAQETRLREILATNGSYVLLEIQNTCLADISLYGSPSAEPSIAHATACSCVQARPSIQRMAKTFSSSRLCIEATACSQSSRSQRARGRPSSRRPARP